MGARRGLMEPIGWIPEGAGSVLDVGCNVGELLLHCRGVRPALQLAGVDVNEAAVERARRALPGADIRRGCADALPFESESFDCVTCIEVLEHLPAASRGAALDEIRRVLKPGGTLLLRVPHAGLFEFMDAANMRFRFPGVYRALLGKGRRDDGYEDGSEGVVWHHHFSLEELLRLAGTGWRMVGRRRGGLLLMPLIEFAVWPFYRLGRADNLIFRALHSLQAWDLAVDYGRASYDILVALRKT